MKLLTETVVLFSFPILVVYTKDMDVYLNINRVSLAIIQLPRLLPVEHRRVARGIGNTGLLCTDVEILEVVEVLHPEADAGQFR